MDVRDRFPLTCRYLGERAPAAHNAEAFVSAVCAAHARGDIASRAVRDLARYEAALLELTPRPPRGPMPRDDEPVVIAPHARVVVYGANLPEMAAALQAGRVATPRPARGWIVLVRDEDGVVEQRILARMEGWLVESFREPTPPSEAIEDDEDRALFAELWSAGALARA